ncbi:unnamed protein product [Paramecium octaurelia]|uniref:Uncharacterized protein n=1 Tax=Paramecium octaurelia TaxID=43137 RepID=A0A8S1SNN6_PAROT|nr:unnamed protein product [Paramecium octaurelia]
MGIICGQNQKHKSQELHVSRPLSQSLKHEYENVECEDQDQLFCPSLTQNYVLYPKFLITQESKCDKEEQNIITSVLQSSSQLSLGFQSEPNNINENQNKQINQNKLKPDMLNSKRMSLEQRYKIAVSPSQSRNRNNNNSLSPLAKMFKGQNSTAKQREQQILTNGKRKLSNQNR